VVAIGVVGALLVGALALWTGHWRRERQQVKRKLDEAVSAARGAAKDTWRQLTAPPSPSPRTSEPPRKSDGAGGLDDDDDDDSAPASGDTPGSRLERDARPRTGAPARRPLRVEDAQRLLSAGRVDDAIQVLYQIRKTSRPSAAVALFLGHAYFHKLWRTDALREYDAALQLRPSLRHDRPLVRNVVAALDDPTSRAARALIRARIGTAALAELRRAARESPIPRVQQRAGRLANDLAHNHRR
jgi:hypothetical protein